MSKIIETNFILVIILISTLILLITQITLDWLSIDNAIAVQQNLDNATENTNINNQIVTPPKYSNDTNVYSKIEPNDLQKLEKQTSLNIKSHTTAMVARELHTLSIEEIATYPLSQISSEDLVIVLHDLLSIKDLEKTLNNISVEELRKILFEKLSRDQVDQILNRLTQDKIEQILDRR